MCITFNPVRNTSCINRRGILVVFLQQTLGLGVGGMGIVGGGEKEEEGDLGLAYNLLLFAECRGNKCWALGSGSIPVLGRTPFKGKSLSPNPCKNSMCWAL